MHGSLVLAGWRSLALAMLLLAAAPRGAEPRLPVANGRYFDRPMLDSLMAEAEQSAATSGKR